MYPEKVMIQEAEKCSRCGVCAAVCPVFRELQREPYSSRGKTEIAFKYLLKNRSLFEKALKAFSYLQMFAPPKGDGQLRHLPFFLSAFGKRRLIPDLSKTPLRKEFPEVIHPSKAPAQMRAGLFSGCFIDFVDPAIGRSLIRGLGRHGEEGVC